MCFARLIGPLLGDLGQRPVGRSVRQSLRGPPGANHARENAVGFQTFVSDGGEEFGAVRAVAPHGRPELVIYVENAGDFTVPLDAVE